MNSRLDALQAAVLSAKLPLLDEANARRRRARAAVRPRARRLGLVTPVEAEGRGHVYHLYVVQTDERERFRSRLADAGIGTAVHYPTPIHRQPAYTGLDVQGGFPVAEGLMERIVSLPISADHTEEEILEVAAAAPPRRSRAGTARAGRRPCPARAGRAHDASGVAELLRALEGSLDRLPDGRRFERHDEAAACFLDPRQLGLFREHHGGSRRSCLE